MSNQTQKVTANHLDRDAYLYVSVPAKGSTGFPAKDCLAGIC